MNENRMSHTFQSVEKVSLPTWKSQSLVDQKRNSLTFLLLVLHGLVVLLVSSYELSFPRLVLFPMKVVLNQRISLESLSECTDLSLADKGL